MADSVKIKITGDDSEFNKSLSGIGQKASSVFKGMMASQIVTKGISMLTNGLRSAINTGMQFEAAMSQVAAISGATGQELELLTETAKRYGETTMFSASQAAEALNYMALAGWDAQQSVDALGGVLDLAAASGMDLGRASDAVTDYLSAFSMEASQAGYMADLMAYAQSKSNTTASMLADAYGNCASSMHAAGQDIETTTAMLMALANQGIKGSEAGTQMAAVMRDLTQKMDHGQIMIGKTAVKVADAQGNFRDLNDIIMDVGKATEGMGTAEQSAAIMTTFTARSVKAIQTILNEGVANVNAYEDALRGSEGTAAEQAETMMDNLQGDVKLFQSAMEGLQITASESTNGIARSMVQEATGILDAMNKAGKAGGIGGMFDAVIAQIPSLLPKVTKGVEGLLSGLGKKLPGLVKNLIATIPDVLGSMGEMVPSLIESLTGALGAAVEGVIVNLPQIAMSLARGLFNSLTTAFSSLAGVAGDLMEKALGLKGTQYKSLGTLDGELTYAVSTDAEVDNSGADADVTAAWQSFVDSLKEYGLTTEQIAQILAFKGTQAELEAWLTKTFPNLDIAARNAIMEKFTVGSGASLADLFAGDYGISAEDLAGIILNTDMTAAGIAAYLETNFPDLSKAAKTAITNALTKNGRIGAGLVSELKGLGIKPEDIAAILTAQSEGDTASVESLLEKKYAGVKEQAITALTNAWNKSPASFDTTGTGVSFGAQLLVDMFTNGKKDDASSVDAALAEAKRTIDAKKQELIDYINGGGEDQEGAQSALGLLEQYDQALTNYANNYANASTTVCQEAGAGILELAQQCDDAVARITAAAKEMQSIQEMLFNAGAGGAKLNDADMMSALNFIQSKYKKAMADAQAEKEAAIQAGQEAGLSYAEAYEQAEAAFQKAIADAQEQNRQDLAKLLGGQTSGGEGLDVAAALSSVWDQITRAASENGQIAQSEVEQILRDAGFGDDIIGKALAAVFGEQPSGTVKYGDMAGHDFGDEVNQFLLDSFSGGEAVDAETLAAAMETNGFSSDIISQVIGKLFKPEDTTLSWDQLNLDSVIGNMDFGTLGDLLKTAIENGLITGVDDTSGADMNQLILQMISESLKGGGVEAPVEAPPLTLTPGEITMAEDTDSKVTEAVTTAVQGAGGAGGRISGVTKSVSIDLEPEISEEGESVETKIVHRFKSKMEGRKVPAKADVNVSIGDVSLAEGEDLSSQIANAIPETTEATTTATITMDGSGIDSSAMSAAATGAVNSAVAAASSAASKATAVGTQFSAGIASGIRSGRAAVVQAAISVAQAALRATKAALQISSPSKLTEGFGRFFDQGLSVGIDEGTGEVVRSAVRLADRVAGAANLRPQLDMSGLTSSVNDAMSGFADAESRREYVFNVNGREMARATDRNYNNALNGYARRIGLGYGRG